MLFLGEEYYTMSTLSSGLSSHYLPSFEELIIINFSVFAIDLVI